MILVELVTASGDVVAEGKLPATPRIGEFVFCKSNYEPPTYKYRVLSVEWLLGARVVDLVVEEVSG